MFKAAVLAGERPGGSDFSRELGLPASVLVDVADQSALQRVLTALEESDSVGSGVVCGPSRDVFEDNAVFREILEPTSFEWLEPDRGPSASALAAARALDHFPVLLTAGDHALLTASLVDEFCEAALATGADVVVGLVPHALVREAFPDSKRTVLKFSDGHFCGSNLFALLTQKGEAAPAFWTRLESERKKPWKMARRIGVGLLVRYAVGKLSIEHALAELSRAMGCRVTFVEIRHPWAAVDVDSVADRDLAVKIIKSRA